MAHFGGTPQRPWGEPLHPPMHQITTERNIGGLTGAGHAHDLKVERKHPVSGFRGEHRPCLFHHVWRAQRLRAERSLEQTYKVGAHGPNHRSDEVSFGGEVVHHRSVADPEVRPHSAEGKPIKAGVEGHCCGRRKNLITRMPIAHRLTVALATSRVICSRHYIQGDFMIDFTTHWCEVPIGRLRVRTAGAGPVLMFTHGLLVDSRIWDEVALKVATQEYTVVLPDLPLGSHTVAVTDRSRLTTSAVADCLMDIADQLHIERFAVLGFDTGGAIAQVATAAHPDRINRLALMSCDAFEHFPPMLIKPFQWAARWSPAMTLALKSLTDPRFQRWPLPLGLVAKHKIDPELVRAWAEPCGSNPEVRADVVAFIKQMNATDTLAAAERLRHFDGPSMVMWSRHDRIFPRRDAQRLADLLPRCQLRWIDDAYTFASLDNPARMTELILEFLALPVTAYGAIVQES